MPGRSGSGSKTVSTRSCAPTNRANRSAKRTVGPAALDKSAATRTRRGVTGSRAVMRTGTSDVRTTCRLVLPPEPPLQRRVMLAAEDQQRWPGFLDDLPQDDRRRSKPNLQGPEHSLRNGPLQDAVDTIAHRRLLQQLHLGDLRIRIHGDERCPSVAHGMYQLAANSGELCNPLGERGGCRCRRRVIDADYN